MKKLSSHILITFLLLTFGCQQKELVVGENPEKKWFKGNLHTHSLWSDGDEYPEMIMDWYKNNGYNFVGLSDHNILQEGEKWITVPNNQIRRNAFNRYLEKYGADWVEYQEDTSLQVRLKGLEEYRSKFEEQGHFLILKSEELTDRFGDKPVHLNATNIKELIEPQHGNSVTEIMQNNIDAVLEQREKTGQPMFPHINHPNFVWGITAEDMMGLENERFFEVFNGHPAVNNYGDSTRIGTEEIWDKINQHYTLNNKPLMLGLATDDSHSYHTFGPVYANVGRAWVIVEAEELSPENIIKNLEAGNFYATTGVQLDYFGFDGSTYKVKVKAEENVNYEIQLLACTEDNEEMKVLRSISGTELNHAISDNYLFIRAKITSDKPKTNPYKRGDVEVAWTQPIKL